MPSAAASTQNLSTTEIDAFLSGGTSSFFLGANRKISKFAMDVESVHQHDFSTTRQTLDVPRNGDAISDIFLRIKGPGVQNGAAADVIIPGRAVAGEAATIVREVGDQCARYCDWAACQMLKNARWICSGTEIDSITGTHCQIYNALFSKSISRRTSFVGDKDYRTRLSMRTEVEFWIPLCFYFCCSYAQAWNLLATNFVTLTLEYTLRSALDLIENGPGLKYGTAVAPALSDYSVDVLIGYVYFSTAERDSRMNETRDVVFAHHQTSELHVFDAAGSKNQLELPTNFPIAFSCLTTHSSAREADGEYGCFQGAADANTQSQDCMEGERAYLLTGQEITFNNKVRAENLGAEFFCRIQHQRHAERVPEGQHENHYYGYYYGLDNPYATQKSGSANYSRINKVRVNLTANAQCRVEHHAIGYNVLTMEGGTVTLRFAS